MKNLMCVVAGLLMLSGFAMKAEAVEKSPQIMRIFVKRNTSGGENEMGRSFKSKNGVEYDLRCSHAGRYDPKKYPAYYHITTFDEDGPIYSFKNYAECMKTREWLDALDNDTVDAVTLEVDVKTSKILKVRVRMAEDAAGPASSVTRVKSKGQTFEISSQPGEASNPAGTRIY